MPSPRLTLAALGILLLAGCHPAPKAPDAQNKVERLHPLPAPNRPPTHARPKSKKREHGAPTPVEPPDSSSPDSSATDPDELALAAALQKLEQGKVAYSTPVSMLTGQSATVVAHMGGSHVLGLTDGMPQGSSVDTANTPVSTKMRMSLRSADFDITPLSTEQQEVGGTQPTDWEWTIVPKHSGQLQLHLAATVELKDLSRDFVSVDRNVLVQVNEKGAIEQFIAKYWQWLLGTLGTGLLALWRFYAARRKNATSHPPLG